MKVAIKLYIVVNLNFSKVQLFNSPLCRSCLYLVTQLCWTLCNSMDCSPLGFSVHGVFQARILDPVAISSSRVSQGLNPCLLCLLCCRWIITCWAIMKACYATEDQRVCVCVCVCVYVCVLVTQSCLILCDPMDCSPTWILSPRNSQVRILEWVAIPFSRVSSWSRDWTQVSCIVGRFFTIWATMKTRVTCYAIENNWKKQNPILKSISTSSPISGSIMPSCVWARNSSSNFKSK